MNLLFPWGLLLLLAIPVLIVIYIIKNKYKEKTVSSSYVWELSKKFLKKKNPLSTIANLLNLIVQCLCIAFLAFALSDPVLTFENGAENEVYILDASASMATLNQDGSTRLDAAKKAIKEDVEDAVNGTTFTLVVADSSSRALCRQISDKDVFKAFVDRVSLDMADSSLGDAMSLAQSLSSEGKGSHFLLYTDQELSQEPEGFDYFKVGDTTVNYAIEDLRLSSVEVEDVPSVLLEADVLSYSGDATLEVDFTIDENLVGTQKVDVKDNELTTVSLTLPDADGKYEAYSAIQAKITNEDDLASDSEYYLYDSSDFDTTNILIVSNSPFYFRSAFRALNRNGMKISYQEISPALYSLYAGSFGYDITIFDSYSPQKLPADSAVWLFNTGESIPDSGFYAQKAVTVEDPGIKAEYAQNTKDVLYQELTKNLIQRDITIKSYMRYTLTEDFTTILTYDNLPFVFAGRNALSQREIVFNFDLHDSDFPLLADFVTLMRNCINYSNPSILTEFNYKAHDVVTFSFPDVATSAKIVTPSNKEEYVEAQDIQSYVLEEVGTYQIEVSLLTGKTRTMKLYSAFPTSESKPLPVAEQVFKITVDSQATKAVRLFDAILPVAIVAALFLLTDWIIYSHEQF